MSELATSLAFAAGHGGGADWHQAVEATLHRLMPVPEGANLGVLYVSDAIVGELDAILLTLRRKTGIEHWVGCVGMGVLGMSGAGEGRNAGGDADEYFGVPALSVLAMRLDPTAFRLIPAQSKPLAELSADDEAWLGQVGTAIGLVHADPHHEQLTELIGDLAERLGFLIGGLASAQGPMAVFADQVEYGVASGVMFAPDLGLSTSLSQGCTPIGPARAITGVHENLLVSLEGEGALACLQADIGSDKIEDLRAQANSLHAAFPVPGSDQADYAVRNLTGIDLAQGLVGVAATPDPGERVLFCRRDADAARADMRRMLDSLADRLSGPPKGGIYVSCLARGPNLFALREELEMIRARFGDFSLAGFYANGEIANNRLYGYTGVLTVFA